MGVEVRYFAGAAAAAGTDGERVDVADGATVGSLLDQLAAGRPRLGPVLEVASVILDEVVVRDRALALRDGAQVDVLPPFAGG